MDLKYIVMTIIKILISVPTVVLMASSVAHGAALMGGHLDNTKNATDPSPDSEEIPDPSALVLPGYNLPENIFNKGKPFYLEKDPLTGKVDFDSKTSLLDVEEYDYAEEPYDKSNIDRKDGSLSSHKASDVNQLTPNFHDFLNLPVKYNPDKYVYPLISSSYANTKVQGNINKYQNLNNHKNFAVTTYKPTVGPTYYTVKTPHFELPTTAAPTTTQATFTKTVNLMDSGMNHPSYDDLTTQKNEFYYTTRSNDYLTTTRPTVTTTKRPLSLLEQLFGEYDEISTTEKTKPPSLFQNLPSNKNKDKPPEENQITEESNAYEYEDYGEMANTVYQTKSTTVEVLSTSPVSTTPLVTTSSTPLTTTRTTTTTSTPIMVTDYELSMPDSSEYELIDESESFEPELNEIKSSTEATTTRVTSLPLGENHFGQNRPNVPQFESFETFSQPIPNRNSDSYQPVPEQTFNQPISNGNSDSYQPVPEETFNKPIPNINPDSYQPVPEETFNQPIPNRNLDSYQPVPEPFKPNTNSGSFNYKKEANSYNKNADTFNQNMGSFSQNTDSFTQNTESFSQHAHPFNKNVDSGHKIPESFNSNQNGESFNFNKNADTFSQSFHNKEIFSQPIPNTNSVRITPDQNSASFVVEHHQTENFGNFGGGSFKEGPFDNSPFRPLIITEGEKDTVSYTVQAKPEFSKPMFSQNFPDVVGSAIKVQPVGSAVNIQPIKTSEASLSIGVPINNRGQVVDEKVNENVDFSKQGGNKIVFPSDKPSSHGNLLPPHREIQGPSRDIQIPHRDVQIPHREVLIPHRDVQIPHRDVLIPHRDVPVPHRDVPLHREVPGPHREVQGPHRDVPPHRDVLGPHRDVQGPKPIPNREVLQLSSKPMYHQLPSDLTPPNEHDLPPPHLEKPRPPWDPRPGHFYNGRPEYIRPPRPPPKPHGEIFKRFDNLPNILPQFRPNAKVSHHYDHPGHKNGYMRQPLLDRPSNRPVGFFEKLVPPPPPKHLHNLRKVPFLEQEFRRDELGKHEQYEFYQHQTPPPQPVRRKSDEPAIETLQMIQAKKGEKVVEAKPAYTKPNMISKDATEKPLYVVYPVNSAPIKLDALDSNKKETVVVGTRAELPLPPSKINQEFNFENPQDRNDSPILKPHPKPSFPVKSDFPYPLERPDIPQENHFDNNLEKEPFMSGNQWSSVQDSRVVSTKVNYKNPNQISVTLKTFTEKPIAVAYTPTESLRRQEIAEKYSMPNYASPVISEIRPGGDKSSEITVSAVMHTHSQMDVQSHPRPTFDKYLANHRIEEDLIPAKHEFQAPFQASLNIDGLSQGWTVVRNDKSKIDRSDQDDETTTMALATTNQFDIENFKPQLFGGFKPLYSHPETPANETASTEEKN